MHEFHHQLRHEAREADERAIRPFEERREQKLVVAGGDRDVWRNGLQFLVVIPPAGHVAGAHLHHHDLRQFHHLLHLGERVARLRPGRILVDDDRHAAPHRHVLDEAHGRGARPAKPQPVVRRHEQDRLGPGLAGRDRMVGGLPAPFGRHAGDHFHRAAGLRIGPLDPLGHEPGDVCPLGRVERHDLAGVAIANNALDPGHARHVFNRGHEPLLVDRLIVVKRAERRGIDAAPGADAPGGGVGGERVAWGVAIGCGRGHGVLQG